MVSVSGRPPRRAGPPRPSGACAVPGGRLARRPRLLPRTLCLLAAAACGGGDAPGPPPLPPPGPPPPVAPALGWETLGAAPVSPGDARHDDLFFLSPDLGWLVNTRGEIHQTRDGGRTWTLLHSDPDVRFRSVGFATPEVGWAGDINAFNRPEPLHALYESRDGGRTWTNITTAVAGPEPVGLCGLWVVDGSTVYAVGRWSGPAVFVRTRDGGASWSSVDLAPLATGAVDVRFFDAEHGLVTGGDGVGNSPEAQGSSRTVVLRTEDGGDTWEVAHSSDRTGTWGWKFSFPTPQVGYLATQGPARAGIVLKTTDGGRTWSELQVAEDVGFSGIGFATAQLGWVGGDDDEVFETLDGGLTWSRVHLGTSLNRFRMLGPDLGYASGRTVYRFERP